MMSDGSLSQDEIDALLFQGGSDSFDSGSTAQISDSEKDNIVSLLDKSKSGIGATLSGMLGKTVSVSLGSSTITSKSSLLSNLPDEIVEVKLDYTGEASGDHLYLIEKEGALTIAGLMSGQDGLDLDAMALASIGEAISQITGTFLTSVEKITKKNVSPSSPEAQSIPKAMVRFPDGDFVTVELIIQIEGDGTVQFTEVFESSILSVLSEQVNSSAPQQGMNQPIGNNMGQQMNPQQMNQQMGQQMGQQPYNQQMGQQMYGQPMGQQMYGQPMSQPMGQPMGQQMYGQPMGQQMYGQPMYQQQNVQGVQYPNLNQVDLSGVDSRNIGLLMDVSMELTVELGRTKWQIKDILGIGEGTIIELDKLAGEPVDILVNKNLIARGEVVVIDENFGVRVTEIVSAGAKSVEK
ncbi:MAG: flagellar motor switch protein FliN [Spirochaetales bacterium]|nr:flagellar motor switch protein FliN [Spirochaetales bacterium]